MAPALPPRPRPPSSGGSSTRWPMASWPWLPQEGGVCTWGGARTCPGQTPLCCSRPLASREVLPSGVERLRDGDTAWCPRCCVPCPSLPSKDPASPALPEGPTSQQRRREHCPPSQARLNLGEETARTVDWMPQKQPRVPSSCLGCSPHGCHGGRTVSCTQQALVNLVEQTQTPCDGY